jgi:hypothetical protein
MEIKKCGAKLGYDSMRDITIQQKNSFEKTQQNKANPNLSFFYLSEEQRELQTQQ